MKLRKMLAIGLTTMSVAALTALTVNAAGTKVVGYDFEGDNSAWYNGGEGGTVSTYTVSNVETKDVTEAGNTFRRLELDITCSASNDNQIADVLHMPSSTIVLDEPIPFVDGQVIKISSKVRSNKIGSDRRIIPGLAINIPENAYKKETIETLTGGVHGWNRWFNNLYKIDYSNGTKVFQNASGRSQWGATAGLNWGAYWPTTNSDQVTTSNLSSNTWYKVDTYLIIGTLDGNAVIEKVRTVVENGSLGDVTTTVGDILLRREVNGLKSLHVYAAWRSPGGTHTANDITVDFDDIEITVFDSEEEVGYTPYYISEDYGVLGYKNWSIVRNWGTDNASNAMQTSVKGEDGVIKVSATDTGNNGQYDIIGIYRNLPVAVTPSTDKDFVVKTKIRNTCDTANVQFMINRKAGWNEGAAYLQSRNRNNTFFDIGAQGVSFRGAQSAVLEGYKDFHYAYTGDTLNKWFNVEFYFDSSDKTLYGSVKDEEGIVYTLTTKTDWEIADIASFSITMHDRDADPEGIQPVSFELASFDFYEVSNDQWLMLTDEDGNEITGINAGDKVCASYKFKPDAGDIVKYYAMVALYSKDENGALKLEEVEVKDLGMNMGYYNGMTDAITIPEGGNYVVKAFIWNSATNKPMMANDEI